MHGVDVSNMRQREAIIAEGNKEFTLHLIREGVFQKRYIYSGYFRAPPIIGLQANSVFHEWTYWRLEALTFPVPIANSRCPD